MLTAAHKDEIKPEELNQKDEQDFELFAHNLKAKAIFDESPRTNSHPLPFRKRSLIPREHPHHNVLTSPLRQVTLKRSNGGASFFPEDEETDEESYESSEGDDADNRTEEEELGKSDGKGADSESFLIRRRKGKSSSSSTWKKRISRDSGAGVSEDGDSAFMFEIEDENGISSNSKRKSEKNCSRLSFICPNGFFSSCQIL